MNSIVPFPHSLPTCFPICVYVAVLAHKSRCCARISSTLCEAGLLTFTYLPSPFTSRCSSRSRRPPVLPCEITHLLQLQTYHQQKTDYRVVPLGARRYLSYLSTYLPTRSVLHSLLPNWAAWLAQSKARLLRYLHTYLLPATYYYFFHLYTRFIHLTIAPRAQHSTAQHSTGCAQPNPNTTKFSPS